MTTTFDLPSQAKAMHAFSLTMAQSNVHAHRATDWAPRLVGAIEAMREEIRADEGGGGMCHLVSEWLWDQQGWERLAVAYLDPKGTVICAGHLINALPDGSLLDSTADQFGEGHSVRLLQPSDPDYGRYRPEFDDEVNPTRYQEFKDFFWSGKPDFDLQDDVRAERGYGWWVQDPSALLAYLEHQVQLGGTEYAPWVRQLKRRPAL